MKQNSSKDKMSNLDKLRLVIGHIKFMIDEDIITEESCGSIKEEIYSTIEILCDIDFNYQQNFEKDMKEFE